MLKRLYVNGFRSLVNFDTTFDRMTLYLGRNGCGKSSVFDVLFKIRQFVSQDGTVGGCFPFRDFTVWEDNKSSHQEFELEVEGNGGLYFYRLAVEHSRERQLLRMAEERLTFDGKPLFEFSAETGEAQLYHDDFVAGPKYPFDWSRSGVGALQERRDSTRLTWFKRLLGRVIVVRPNPASMGAESREEVKSPSIDLRDFASWFRHLSQENQRQVFQLTEKMAGVLDGFDSFKLAEAGESRMLSVGFSHPSGRVSFLKFHDLSDGERVLIALYALLTCQPDEPSTLCIDEPENFLALPEIQPWLDELDESLQSGDRQALLISHHPKLINFLALDAGRWLHRDTGGPTRERRITAAEADTGLPVSELVARGWLVDE